MDELKLIFIALLVIPLLAALIGWGIISFIQVLP